MGLEKLFILVHYAFINEYNTYVKHIGIISNLMRLFSEIIPITLYKNPYLYTSCYIS